MRKLRAMAELTETASLCRVPRCGGLLLITSSAWPGVCIAAFGTLTNASWRANYSWRRADSRRREQYGALLHYCSTSRLH